MAEVKAVLCSRCSKPFAQEASNKSTPPVCDACKAKYAQRKLGGGKVCMKCGSLITDDNAYIVSLQKLFEAQRTNYYLCSTCCNEMVAQAPDDSQIRVTKLQKA